MSSEPNKPMDRPLNAYAAKRRQDAGAPIELHPATRRMLQAEAARQIPRASGEASSWTRLFTSWLPRLAGAAMLCAFLGLIGWALFQPEALRREQNLAQLSRDEVLLADKLPTETPAPENAPLTAPLGLDAPAAKPAPVALFETPRITSEPAAREDVFAKAAASADAGDAQSAGPQGETAKLAKSLPEKEAAMPAGGAGLGGGARELKLATATPPAPEARRFSRTAEPAPQRAEPASTSRFQAQNSSAVSTLANQAGTTAKSKSAETTKSEETRLTLAATPPSAAPAPVAAVTVGQASLPENRARYGIAASEVMMPAPTQNWSFHLLPALAGQRTDARKKPVGADVLASFSWQQSGRQLRVVDADGSVYLGEVLEPAAAAPGSPPQAQLGFKQVGDDQVARLPASARQNQAAGTFRVSGTNQTLRQRVIFFGQLLREPLPGAAQDLGIGQAQRTSQPAPAMRGAAPQTQAAGASLRIEAQATLSDGRVVPIQAVGQ